MGIIKNVLSAIRNQMDVDLFRAAMEVRCEHNPTDPCPACENQARADRW